MESGWNEREGAIMGHWVMIDDEAAVQYPHHFEECAHDGDMDHSWIIEPWTEKEHHEAHCMECGADTVAVHEVEWDIDADDAPTATIIRATWAAPQYAD